MKTFTAKQFSRAPAQVFDAAREDGKVEVTHDRFFGHFEVYYVPENISEADAAECLKLKTALDEHFSNLIKDGMSRWFPKEKGPEGPDSE